MKTMRGMNGAVLQVGIIGHDYWS